MNLKLHLMARIALAGFLCLLAIASFSLFHSARQAQRSTQQMADSLGKQLESQLLLIHSGIGQSYPFPDFELWKQTGAQAGVCVAYAAIDGGMSRSLCNGTKAMEADWPANFEAIYRRIFAPGLQGVRLVKVDGRNYGSLTITPSAELEISKAWNKTLDLMALSTVTVFAVCLLVYLSISQALRPAQSIVAGLEDMAAGNLLCRLPSFQLNEWQRISAAINHLAASQQQLLEERQNLAVKLINLQEEERRALARELHDELGQCLAAINAIATSIRQTAARQCPELVDEAEHIGRITAYMLSTVRNMLGRLRPAEFDELGLSASLNSLVAGWNARSGGKTGYRLRIDGDCASLSEAAAVTLFRIAQEGLTNIARHAHASSVSIGLTVSEEAAILNINDDGIATKLPFADVTGIGLLGIRERIAALHGQLKLAIAKPHGLILEVNLPNHAVAEKKA